MPMVYLVTLGGGGGSIASYDRSVRHGQRGPSRAGLTPARPVTTAAA
ncbi:hypothetical protein [Zoogloea sp.]|nr:hypothetical protein [Zoogloea sp.]